MKIQVQTFRAPSWLVPLLILVALALLPLFFVLALGILGLALGTAAIRYWLLPPVHHPHGPSFSRGPEEKLKDSSVIDVDYEVKDENEKN